MTSKAPVATPILIDGSFGEGGGQIIRNAVTLACILRKHIKIEAIRANRPNPGLASQHLESILALKRLTGSSTDVDLRKGLTAFELHGEEAKRDSESAEGVDTTIDLVTAGSVSLCVQVLLPYLLTLGAPSRLRIIGGTHVMKAPNFDYLQRVFIPVMGRLGYKGAFDIQLRKPGYFPRGGGSIQLTVEGAGAKFKHFSLLQRGTLLKQSAILNITPKMGASKAEFLDTIERSGLGYSGGDVEVRVVSYASVEYFLEFEETRIGFYWLAEGRNPRAEQLFEGIKRVAKDFKEFSAGAAAVDEFMQDQLIIYMALAKLADPSGRSEIRCHGEPTDHTTSAIHVAQLLMGGKFNFQVKKAENGASDWLISI